MDVFDKCQARTKKLRRAVLMEWKSTDTKMYLNCECGAHHCYQGYFGQFVQCTDCEQIYFVNQLVEVVPLKASEVPNLRHIPLKPVVTISETLCLRSSVVATPPLYSGCRGFDSSPEAPNSCDRDCVRFL